MQAWKTCTSKNADIVLLKMDPQERWILFISRIPEGYMIFLTGLDESKSLGERLCMNVFAGETIEEANEVFDRIYLLMCCMLEKDANTDLHKETMSIAAVKHDSALYCNYWQKAIKKLSRKWIPRGKTLEELK